MALWYVVAVVLVANSIAATTGEVYTWNTQKNNNLWSDAKNWDSAPRKGSAVAFSRSFSAFGENGGVITLDKPTTLSKIELFPKGEMLFKGDVKITFSGPDTLSSSSGSTSTWKTKSGAKVDPTCPDNWIVNGQPASKRPCSGDTAIIPTGNGVQVFFPQKDGDRVYLGNLKYGPWTLETSAEVTGVDDGFHFFGNPVFSHTSRSRGCHASYRSDCVLGSKPPSNYEPPTFPNVITTTTTTSTSTTTTTTTASFRTTERGPTTTTTTTNHVQLQNKLINTLIDIANKNQENVAKTRPPTVKQTARPTIEPIEVTRTVFVTQAVDGASDGSAKVQGSGADNDTSSSSSNGAIIAAAIVAGAIVVAAVIAVIVLRKKSTKSAGSASAGQPKPSSRKTKPKKSKSTAERTVVSFENPAYDQTSKFQVKDEAPDETLYDEPSFTKSKNNPMYDSEPDDDDEDDPGYLDVAQDDE